jgi:hypothetical protein
VNHFGFLSSHPFFTPFVDTGCSHSLLTLSPRMGHSGFLKLTTLDMSKHPAFLSSHPPFTPSVLTPRWAGHAGFPKLITLDMSKHPASSVHTLR